MDLCIGVQSSQYRLRYSFLFPFHFYFCSANIRTHKKIKILSFVWDSFEFIVGLRSLNTLAAMFAHTICIHTYLNRWRSYYSSGLLSDVGRLLFLITVTMHTQHWNTFTETTNKTLLLSHFVCSSRVSKALCNA